MMKFFWDLHFKGVPNLQGPILSSSTEHFWGKWSKDDIAHHMPNVVNAQNALLDVCRWPIRKDDKFTQHYKT